MKKQEVAKKMGKYEDVRSLANEGMRSGAGDKKYSDKFLALKKEDRGRTNILQGRMYRGLHKAENPKEFKKSWRHLRSKEQ